MYMFYAIHAVLSFYDSSLTVCGLVSILEFITSEEMVL